MTTPTPHDWESKSHGRTLVLLGATMLGVYLCYRMAKPFTSALAWAVALAVVFVPLQRWLESRLKRSNLAAALSVLVIGLMVVVPAIFVGQRMIREAAKGAERIETIVKSGEWRRNLDAHPRWAPLAERIGQEIDLPEAVQSLAAWLSSAAGAIVKGSLVQAVGFCLIFYLLFFFLRDRRAAFQALRVLSPLSETEMDRLLNRVGDTIHATIYGMLAVAMIQGFLGGLVFWALGLPAPLLWGVVMSVLAIIPVLGTFVIWIPAACFLALEGSWVKALILVIWGMLVIGTIDNLLRPILVGKRLKLHTVLAFLSVIGGLAVFGGAGLILGPVVLTITTVLLELWPHRRPYEAGSGIKPEELVRFENEGGLLAPLEKSPVGPDRNSSP